MTPVAIGVRALLVLIGLSPFIPPLVAGIPLVEYVGWGLDQWFAYQCHREPGRSLHFLDGMLPVCVRCLGIYLGLGLGAVVLRPRLSALVLRVWVAVAALLMLSDVLTQWLGLRPDWPLLRLVTGLALSYPVGIALVQAARGERI